MEKYNRDGPPEKAPSWIDFIFWMVSGFLIGGLTCLCAALLLLAPGGCGVVVLALFVTAPFAALFGGIVGTWLAWKRPQ